MIGTWLGRLVGAGIVASVVAACSTSTSGGDDSSQPGVDAGKDSGDAGDGDASVNNRVTGDGGACISNCHQGDPCTAAAQCASGICTASVCVEPSCTDGTLDGTETAPDCGGTCQACADGLACLVGGDCESGVCNATTKTCAVPTSTDGVENGNETGDDCGSSGTGTNTGAPACPAGQGCKVASDCVNKLCGVNDVCLAATCTDGTLNGTETAVDCGGSQCNPCPDSDGCLVGSDCTSKVCTAGKCAVPTDTDGITNGNETDTDCGSSGTNDNGENTSAPPCPDGETCTKGTDCVDLVCGANGTCSLPSCTDGQINGGETDTDCGNGIITGCPACPDKETCSGNSDCTSLHCVGSTCAVPTDTDGIQNGKESDIDCGSSGSGESTGAPACPDINATTKKVSVCSAGTDCNSTFCNATEKQCVDAQSCALPALAKASGIQDIKTLASSTIGGADAVGTPNLNGAGLYAGIDTCGTGEATDPAGQRSLESCCKSLDTTVSGEGAIRIDKYEVTTGRVRQFIESINALEGDYNLQKWVTAQIATGTKAGLTLSAQIPTGQNGSTDVRTLYPSSQTGTLNMVQQLGGISLDTAVPSQLQGCFVGPGNAGASTYWWDSAGSAIVGSPPRNFTQDYYDIKSQNCAPYWMAAAFCAWDGGRLPTPADYELLWGSSTYPWGSADRNYQDMGGLTAFEKVDGTTAITNYTINNLNDDSGGNFYFYPSNSNPSTGITPDTVDNGTDFTPYIASPGRFTLDVTLLAATGTYANDHWYDVGANMFEYRALASSNFASNQASFCDTSDGVANTGTTTSTCPTTAGQTTCTTVNYAGKYLCGYQRGGPMPGINWQGGSWEVHGIPTGGADNNYVEPMQTQYGKTGFRCARPAE
jgi:hypothetical protein